MRKQEDFNKVTSEIRSMISTLTEYLERFSVMPFIYALTEKDSLEAFKVIKGLSSRVECDLVTLTYCIWEDYDEEAKRHNAACKEYRCQEAKGNIEK